MLDGSDTALSHELRFLAPWFWIAHTSLSSYYPFVQEVPQCSAPYAGTGYLAADSRSPMKQVAS